MLIAYGVVVALILIVTYFTIDLKVRAMYREVETMTDVHTAFENASDQDLEAMKWQPTSQWKALTAEQKRLLVDEAIPEHVNEAPPAGWEEDFRIRYRSDSSGDVEIEVTVQ
jgi:hypothetical protein